MPDWKAYCKECGDSAIFETEEGAVGWIFGHGLRTEHDHVYKTKVSE